MTSLHVSLPEDISAFVTAQMAQDGYTSADLCVSNLLREAQRNGAKQKLDALLLEGLDSPLMPHDIDWKNIEREALEGLPPGDIRP